MRTARHLPLLGLLWLATGASVTLAAVAPAQAQPLEEKKRWTARKLGGEGIDLFEAGDYAAALEKFKTADELVPAPTFKLYAARCLDKLDRMLEAAAKYRAAIETELDGRAPAVHHQARKDAVKELAALMELIPTIEVVVQGPGADAADIELDARTLAVEELGKRIQVDPGSHVTKAKRLADGATVHHTVISQRGKAERAELKLPPPQAAGTGRVEDPNVGDGWRLGGWATLGVSGAVLAAGAVVGIVVLTKRGALDDACPEGVCPPDQEDEVRSFDTLRTVSSVGLISGTAGVASALLMLLLAPDAAGVGGGAEPASDAGPKAALGLAPGGIGLSVSGRF